MGIGLLHVKCVAVAGEARLSCSVVIVYRLLLSMTSVTNALALRLRCRYDWRESLHIKKWCAIARVVSQYSVSELKGSSNTGLFLCHIKVNKWPTRGFWTISCVLSRLPTTNATHVKNDV